MATFRAVIRGSRGEVSRLGHSIISADINGWKKGVQVIGRRDEDTGEISFEIFETGGSNGGKFQKIAEVK